MRSLLLAPLLLALMLPACARLKEARVNPFNWFKVREATTLEPKGGYQQVTDDRPLVDQVLTLVLEPVPGGAVLRATALPPTQGFWSGDLVAEADGKPVDGVLTYRFVAYPPPRPAATSTQASREITAGVYLSAIDLAEVRTITVVGAQNIRSARR